jgi:hypothetical protein
MGFSSCSAGQAAFEPRPCEAHQVGAQASGKVRICFHLSRWRAKGFWLREVNAKDSSAHPADIIRVTASG